MPNRVVVAGGSGFVGRSLVACLQGLGAETISLSSSDLDLREPESVAALKRTVGDEDALVIVSAITREKGRDVGTMMQNLTMGHHLSTFLETAGCSHVVYLSSDAVYEDDINPVSESSHSNPSDLYGVMHVARERMLAYAMQNSDIPFLILRPSLLYGPKDPHNGYGPNRFLRTALEEGKITLFGNGEEKRDHIYVEDLSRLLASCLENRSAGVLNVATGVSTPFSDLAETISKLCGDGVEIERLPRAVPITHRHFDITQTLRAFPSFRYTSLESGLYQTVRAIKDDADA